VVLVVVVVVVVVVMDCPPRVNISHYTHHNFRSGSAFRRVITSRLLRPRSDTHPSRHPSPCLFQRTLSPSVECTCFNHPVRFAFGGHSWGCFFARAFSGRVQPSPRTETFFWSSSSLRDLTDRCKAPQQRCAMILSPGAARSLH